jgi:serine/threonine protein kinase
MENYRQLNWEKRINILLKISMALQDIHSSGFVHRNFHSGNILQTDKDTPKISDIALPKYTVNNKNSQLYGVLPYVAPEILRGEEFSSAADVYSFSMIMWEISSGIPPFNNRMYDSQLAIDICNGARPKLSLGIPKSYSTLMERCWDADPLLRPSVQEITAMLFRWHFHLEQNRSIDIRNAFTNKKGIKNKYSFQDIDASSINTQPHQNVNYNSQLLDFKDLPEPTNYYSRALHIDSAFGSSTNSK